MRKRRGERRKFDKTTQKMNFFIIILKIKKFPPFFSKMFIKPSLILRVASHYSSIFNPLSASLFSLSLSLLLQPSTVKAYHIIRTSYTHTLWLSLQRSFFFFIIIIIIFFPSCCILKVKYIYKRLVF